MLSMLGSVAEQNSEDRLYVIKKGTNLYPTRDFSYSKGTQSGQRVLKSGDKMYLGATYLQLNWGVMVDGGHFLKGKYRYLYFDVDIQTSYGQIAYKVATGIGISSGHTVPYPYNASYATQSFVYNQGTGRRLIKIDLDSLSASQKLYFDWEINCTDRGWESKLYIYNVFLSNEPDEQIG